MIAEIIKNRMYETGITISELARRIGCRRATLSDYLNGRHKLNSKTLEDILKLLNLKIN